MTTTRFVSKKTAVVIAIVAAGAISAVLVAAAMAPVYASAFGGPRFGMHGGPPGAFGAGPFGYGGMPPWLGQGAEANWTGSIPLDSVQADVIEAVKSNVNVSVADAASAVNWSRRQSILCLIDAEQRIPGLHRAWDRFHKQLAQGHSGRWKRQRA